MKERLTHFLVLLPVFVLGSCGAAPAESDVVWAVNVGGASYLGVDGTSYEAESSVSGGSAGTIEVVNGSQDAELYRTFRTGDIKVARDIANGTYDITFHFAEPEDIERDGRIFSAFAEGQLAADGIDVMLWRDGKVRSALTVTVPGIVIEDGVLDIRFEADKREPILSALVVRKRAARDEPGELVWSDEFDEDGAPNADHWNIEEWAAGVVNDEDQAYTARSKNVRVEGGNLVIETHREDYDGARYTSGRLQSMGKADFLYGRIEVRARLPEGQGTWPAIWMLSSRPFTYATNCTNDEDWQGSSDCDAWPNSGEIDIMEHVGYQMNHVHGTVHSRDFHWTIWNQRKGRILLEDVAGEFHVYALEWTPDRIDILVDDTSYLTYINEGKGWQEWPFDQPFHVILNVAIGGGWGRAGGPVDDSILPQRMLVDYVRVYRRRD